MDNTLENAHTPVKEHPLRDNVFKALNQYKWPLLVAINWQYHSNRWTESIK